MPDGSVSAVTCLGCGCTCDDIIVTVNDERIVDARNACALGAAWFGDGSTPWRVRTAGRDATIDDALDAIAAVLARSKRPLVYLAADVSCETQRAAAALADVHHALLDSLTTTTAGASILGAQALGRASATLGEVRNAADVLVFWGVDPSERYPRFCSRYAPEPRGLHVPEGRDSRRVIAVDVGDARGPLDADLRITVDSRDEIAALSILTSIAGRLTVMPTVDEIASEVEAATSNPSDRAAAARGIARQLAPLVAQARYAVFVVDGESSQPIDLDRTESLISMTQAFNGTTRCALVTLRGGGNRVGADAVLTSQTGYPMAIDFAHRYPRYLPYDAADTRLHRGEIDAVVVIGSVASIPPPLAERMASLPHAVIGPRATESALANGVASIDTGVAGIHEGGTALRMDDVPLPLRPVVNGAVSATAVVRELNARVIRTLPGSPART